MSMASRRRSIPVGRLVPEPCPPPAVELAAVPRAILGPTAPVRGPARWAWPATVAVAFSPFILTGIGLAVVAGRHAPRPAGPMVASGSPVEAAVVAPTAVALETVEPGEARPPVPGQ